MYGKDSPTKSNYAIGRDCFIFLDDRLFVFSALTLKNKSMDVSLTNTIYVNLILMSIMIGTLKIHE
jgi:hypothetical protein